MARFRLPSLLVPLLMLAACGGRPAVGTAAPSVSSADASEVVAAVEQMFAAMKTHDVSALRSRVLEGARIYQVKREESGSVGHHIVTDTQFVEGTAGDPTHEVDEHFTAPPEVRIDGPVATVWGHYEVFVDGARRHCGVDSVQLVEMDSQWRVSAITYTARDCAAD